MDPVKYNVQDKEITLYRADSGSCPLIVYNNFNGDGSDIYKEFQKMELPAFHFLNVSGIKWNHDMSPWYNPPLPWEEEAATGGADEYLEMLITEIIPSAKERLYGEVSELGIVGYSLAGLFSLYALYRCDVFDMAASVSGSLWFPGFKDFVFKNEMKKKPRKLYLSLGDKEARTRNQTLRTIQENTESIAAYYKEKGLDATFELNPGNHFREPELRTAKGVRWLLT